MLIDRHYLPSLRQEALSTLHNGRCVPTTAVPADAQALLGDCDAQNKCVPSYFVERAAKFIPPSCTSVNGAEGRCLSECIPADLLASDVLAAGHLQR